MNKSVGFVYIGKHDWAIDSEDRLNYKQDLLI